MSIKYYKLTGYDPFWIYCENKYCREHIEQIAEDITSHKKNLFKNKFNLKVNGAWVPFESPNFSWNGVFDLKATGTIDQLPKYVKVEVDGTNYYYYLVDRPKVRSIGSEGEVYYDAYYELDEYNTAFWNKLEIIRNFNPSVYALMGFLPRWNERIEQDGRVIYEIDYIKQRHLSNTIQNRNNMMIRELAYYTNADNIFTLNFGNLSIPNSYTIQCYSDTTATITLSNFPTFLTKANSRGRYEYIVAKSSAKMRSSTTELLPAFTDQQFLIIPITSDYAKNILHGLNDFDDTQDNANILDPWGDNEIGLWECDIPYSYFWGLVATNQYGAKMEYAHQPMGNSQFINIPFFTLDNNAPIIIDIIDYTQYDKGYYGKFYYMIQNIYLWTPETEPFMWNPTNYSEVYNNGSANLVLDASMFNFTWDSEDVNTFGVQAYLSLSSDLNLAYNFGENTNEALVTFDNTQTTIGKGSITNFYLGSNSANYYTNNASSIATSVKNRESEQTQAWADAGLETARAALSIVPKSLLQAINPFHYVKAGASTAITTAKIMTDTALEQQRANRSFYSSLNNMTSAPSQTLADPSVKGVIPNKYGLFETYARKLHPKDERVEFTYLLHNGYPINHVVYANDVLDCRQIMNIIHWDTTHYQDDLMELLQENDQSIFNTIFWNKRFLAWLNNNSSIYNTRELVNCTDYLGINYVNNIEKVLPPSPSVKTNIARYITNFRLDYVLVLEELREDNSNAPEDLWDDIEITNLTTDQFVIQAKSTSTKYYGIVTRVAAIHGGFINDTDTGIKHYFNDIAILCPSYSEEIRCPDGTVYDASTFNFPIVIGNLIEEIESYFLYNCYTFNQSITFTNNLTRIGSNFMSLCYAFNQPLTLPNNLTSIGSLFMSGCENFNQQLILPNTLTSIGSSFMSSCRAFNQPLTLPNNLTSIGVNFMYECRNMSSDINIQSLTSNLFGESNNTLSTTTSSAALYVTGVTIIADALELKQAFLDKFPNRTTSPFRNLK